jgi:hypothetical protein
MITQIGLTFQAPHLLCHLWIRSEPLLRNLRFEGERKPGFRQKYGFNHPFFYDQMRRNSSVYK